VRSPATALRRVDGRITTYAVLVVLSLALALLGRRGADGLEIGLWGAHAPFAFLIFGLVLLGVALFHRRAVWFAVGGAALLTVYTAIFVPGFVGSAGEEHPGLWGHFLHEGEHTLLNLGGLLLGFAVLAKTFETSHAPQHLRRLLPRRPVASALSLLGVVWILSAFLDNIAAAMIGGVLARTAFRGRVTLAFLAALVAASNAGGAWSVLGDTTTTMLWIAGVPATHVFPAAVGSVVALAVLAVFAIPRQNAAQTVVFDPAEEHAPLDRVRLFLVLLILVGAVATNVLFDKPFLGVWAAILVGTLIRPTPWGEVPAAGLGTAFLLSLVWCASLMPVSALPPATWRTTLGLGFVSAVFDNIPLTKLALDQQGYDWPLLAYAVGFGGSMLWFGSSAGVALSKDFPETRSAGRWLREGWFVALAYVLGFAALLAARAWLFP
jgi:Na+/H+ antiporter NhaD/arsenite permease-like protein